MNDFGRLENRVAGAEAIDQFHSAGRT
jgi:hypothetical protein